MSFARRVIVGFNPTIHAMRVEPHRAAKVMPGDHGVDGRVKPGHDGGVKRGCRDSSGSGFRVRASPASERQGEMRGPPRNDRVVSVHAVEKVTPPRAFGATLPLKERVKRRCWP